MIAAFGNGIFALFIALFELFEITQEVSSGMGSAVHTNIQLFFIMKISVEGYIFYKLREFHPHSLHMSPLSENMGVVFLHIFGLIVIDSINLVSGIFEFDSYAFPIYLIDSLLSVTWLGIMIYLLTPYISRNGRVLLLCSPSERQRDMVLKKMREVSFIEGVVHVQSEKIWMLSANKLVGSIVLNVHDDADFTLISNNATEVLSTVLDCVNIEISVETTTSL